MPTGNKINFSGRNRPSVFGLRVFKRVRSKPLKKTIGAHHFAQPVLSRIRHAWEAGCIRTIAFHWLRGGG